MRLQFGILLAAALLSISPAVAQTATTTQSGAETATPKPAAVAGKSQYIRSVLKVLTNKESKGCQLGGWECMAGLCKTEYVNTAWRGEAGCWELSGVWICYFDCHAWQDTAP
jgi:curli biogenesis system outer membrane secretion channel CsgG